MAFGAGYIGTLDGSRLLYLKNMEMEGTVIQHLLIDDIFLRMKLKFGCCIKYVIPSDNDMCTYNIEFEYGDESLECKVKSREEAFQEHKQLEQEGYLNTFAQRGPFGKIEVRAANVPPHEVVLMSMKVSSFARLSGKNTISISFPVKFIDSQEICSFFTKCPNDFDFQLKTLPIMLARESKSNVLHKLEYWDTIWNIKCREKMNVSTMSVAT
jgi:hypothetical protein